MVKHNHKRWRIKTATGGGKGKRNDYQEEDVNGYMFLALQDAGALIVIEVRGVSTIKLHTIYQKKKKQIMVSCALCARYNAIVLVRFALTLWD